MKATRMGLTGLVLLGAGVTVAPVEAEAQRRQRDVITREEILASAHKELDLFQVVRSLRPHFLAPARGVRSMGGASGGLAVLYVDGNRVEDLAQGLKALMPTDVEEVRYLEPSRAQDRFGIDHTGGAVLVTRYKAPPPEPVPPGDDR